MGERCHQPTCAWHEVAGSWGHAVYAGGEERPACSTCQVALSLTNWQVRIFDTDSRILLLDRTREDWQQVSACDDVLKRQSVRPTGRPPSRDLAPVLSGAERAAEVAAVIVHCKAMLAEVGDDGVTMTAIKADLLLFNPGAAGDALKMLRIDPDVIETKVRRAVPTRRGGTQNSWCVVLQLATAV